MTLLKALQSPALGLRGLQTQNSDWYMKQLQSDLQQKRQVGTPVGLFASCLLGSMLCPQVSSLHFHAVSQVSVPNFHDIPQVSVSLASMLCPPGI